MRFDRPFGAAVVAGCAYELAAIGTRGRVPPITALMWSLPVGVRYAVFLGTGVVLWDHFFRRAWS